MLIPSAPSIQSLTFALLPAREFPMDDKGRTHFRQCFRERFEGDPAKSGIYKDISTGIASAGIEYYLPLFLMKQPAISTTCRKMRYSSRTATPRLPSRPFGVIPAPATPCCRVINHALLAPEELFLTDEGFIAAKCYGRLPFQAKWRRTGQHAAKRRG